MSALEGRGIAELWQTIAETRARLEQNGQKALRRSRHRRSCLEAEIDVALKQRFVERMQASSQYEEVVRAVDAEELSAREAAALLVGSSTR